MAADVNLPIIPDKVVKKLREGKDVSLEEISHHAAERQDQMYRDKQSPLRAEDLKPISKAEATRRRTFTGEGMPSFPTTRRVIPPPYQRPSATIRQDHGKTWQTCRMDQVEPGDMVAGCGLITEREDRIRYDDIEIAVVGQPESSHTIKAAVGTDVYLTNVSGDQFSSDAVSIVRVFRKAPEDSG